MIDYFKNDWVGIAPPTPTQPLEFDLTTDIAPPSGPAIDYAIGDAHWILDHYPRPVTVLLSGGIDSQAMADAFVRTRRRDEFEIVAFDYNDGLNAYDIDWARAWADRVGTKIEVRSFDVIAFHESGELFDYAERYHNNSPHTIIHTKLASTLPGTAVFAGNPLSVKAGVEGLPNYSLFATHRYARIESKPIVGQFFMYSPEVTYTLLERVPFEAPDTYEMKTRRYRDNGFRILDVPKKFHGFEALKEYYDQFDDRVPVPTRRYYVTKYGSNRAYDHLFRHVLRERYPYSQKAVGRLETRLCP